MKGWLLAGIIALVMLVGAFFALSSPSGDTASSTTTATTKPTTFADITTAVAQGGKLLDVRTAEEYTAGHIKGATNLSLQAMQAGQLPSGSKNQTLYVYCHSGNRSKQATTILRTAGYTNVTDLGAITHVESIGGTIITGS